MDNSKVKTSRNPKKTAHFSVHFLLTEAVKKALQVRYTLWDQVENTAEVD
jgi:hypothetical protein